MQTKLADWGVELAFFRTKVGKEFDVISQIRSDRKPSPTFFGAYGYFDLLAVRHIESLAVESLVPLDSNVLESAPFRFFADSGNSSVGEFTSKLNEWKTAIAVFLKINPTHFQTSPSVMRSKTAGHLRTHFNTLPVHVFFGLGYSEILVLAGGDDLPKLLGLVTSLRNPPSQESVVGPSAANEPLFVKTTTFPLASYDKVHSGGNYEPLRNGAKIRPVVKVTCSPRVEEDILHWLRPGISARNSYGESDLVLYWDSKEGVSFGEFAEFLTTFRTTWSGKDLIAKTTSCLETDRQPNQEMRDKGAVAPVTATNPADAELFKILNRLEPEALRASLADLVLRLCACLGDKNLEADYRDMGQTLEYIKSAGKKISESTDLLEKMKARLTLTEVADLARSAINQRYAGLETHPETLAHSQSPILCDIRSIVLASSCLPSFVFNNLKPDSGQCLWPGYVLFGNAYTPKWCPQNILALPTTSIYRPIEEWWRITHEMAHAVFDVLKVRKHLPSNLHQWLIDIYGESRAAHVLDEFFANWFDWHYIFQRDTAWFIRNIWKWWIQMPVVWEQKQQYLVRSYALVLCETLPEIVSAWSKGREIDHLMPLLKQRWQQFIELLKLTPDIERYISGIDETMITNVLDHARGIIPVLQFLERNFEKNYGIEGLSERLNPPYPSVQNHVEHILAGEVVTDAIPNPCKLHLELLKKLDGASALRAEIAYILSLEHSYVTTVAPLNEL